MSRINTNISAIQSIHRLTASQGDLAVRLERLSTGLRINRGKDDPAGLIASESLRSELTGISKAIENSNRAISVLTVGDAALGEVSALLLEVRGLINSSANDGAMSDTEIEANQLQIDSLLESIDRIASTTQFNGEKLLNGNLNFTTSGLAASAIADATVFGARVPDNGSTNVTVEVTDSAETGRLIFTGAGLAASNNVTVEITGTDGTEQFSFAASAPASAMAAAINDFALMTGVSATLSSDSSAMFLDSTAYGSDAFVRVQTISGTFALTDNDGTSTTSDEGFDVVALVNGQTANANGRQVKLRSGGLDVDMLLTADLATQLASTTFSVTGGGARFQLGPDVVASGQLFVGIPSISTGSLGNSEDGFLNQIGGAGSYSISGKNFTQAERIVQAAIQEVSVLRGRIGGIQSNQLETNINSQQVAFENVTAAESAIRDADYANEVAALTRAQILVQSGTQVLAIANQQPQNVLALLG